MFPMLPIEDDPHDIPFCPCPPLEQCANVAQGDLEMDAVCRDSSRLLSMSVIAIQTLLDCPRNAFQRLAHCWVHCIRSVKTQSREARTVSFPNYGSVDRW